MSVGASTTWNGTVMNTRAGVLGGLAGVRVQRGDVELVAAPAELDVDAPVAGRVGRLAVRLVHPRRGLTVIVRVRDRRPAQRVRRGVLGDVDRPPGRGPSRASVGGLANRISWTPMNTANTAISTVSSAATTTAGENVRPWRGDSSGLRDREHGLGRDRRVAALAPPLADDVLGVEPEVERVVAQEALRVDGARQLGVVALLERGEVAGADLRVALGAVEVDALALARRRAGARAATGRPRVASRAVGVARRRGPAAARLVPSCRRPRPRRGPVDRPGAGPPGRSIRRMRPTYPRASSWSMIRAARA